MEVKELEGKVDKLRADIMHLIREFKRETNYSVSEIEDMTVQTISGPPEVVHLHITVSYDGQSTFRK